MTDPTRSDVERRALAIIEALAESPDEPGLMQRLLASEDAAVAARVRSIASMSAAVDAMPTDIQFDGATTAMAPPERFGPFRIVAPIGQGGMGEVWRGERDDGLFDQTVAIKFIQPYLQIRAGEAFDSERRILAGLEHPNIARLIDGGTTPDGRACLVMEYIDGQPFDAGCAPLPPGQRIALFRQALDAVGYAHGRLIAHGDLKPSNILVDRANRVRLLDFGIARLVTDEANAFRLTGAVTSSFASPARLAGEPPSIPDDVFALGRLLGLVIANGADRDLAAIAAKASADDEADRYANVPELAADLDRWSRRYPVRAVPRTLLYVAKRYGRRNWIIVTGLIGMTLLAVIAVISYARAESERQNAERRFVAARAMANYMLLDLYDALAVIPHTVKARERIVEISQRHLNTLSENSDPRADIRLDVARSYTRLSEVQGGSGNSNLGQSRKALDNLNRADKILTDLHRRMPGRDDITMELAKTRIRIADSNVYSDHNPSRALAIEKAAETLLISGGPEPRDATMRGVLWLARITRGDILTWLDRTNESIPLLKSELALAEARQSKMPASDEWVMRRARNLRMIGEAEYYAHQPQQAIVDLRKAVDVLQARFGINPDQPNLKMRISGIASTLGNTQVEQGQVAAGVAMMRYGYGLVASLSALDANDVQAQRRTLAFAGDFSSGLVKLGRLDEAERLILATRAAYLALIGRFPDDAGLYRAYARSIRAAADLKRAQGKPAEACAWLVTADRAWSSFNHRWGISPSDKGDEVAEIKRGLAACPHRG